MISLFSVQMYFSCISNVFLIWAYPISCLACLCLLYQMVKIQCVAFHRWSWIFSFETSLTSASTRWLWLWWTWWWECWSWPFAGNDCSLYQNTICWQQMIQYVVFHRCSSWIVSFKTGLTSASTRWWWVWLWWTWWWWWVYWSWRLWSWALPNDHQMIKIQYVVFHRWSWIKIQQYLLSQDPALRLCIPSLLLRFISTLPGYDDYKRMVNDDECAVCICLSVFLCVGVFCFVHFFTPNSGLTQRQCKISPVTR